MINCRETAATVHDYQFGLGWICRRTNLHFNWSVRLVLALAVTLGLSMSMSICPGQGRLLEVSHSPWMIDAGL